MGKLLNEFKEFAVKGNVVDMAVGVVIGGAFGKIVSSLVSDVIMPLVGAIVGGVQFAGLKAVLKPAAEGQGEVAIHYGNFLQAVVDFTIIAAAIFAVIKAIMRLKTAPAPAPAPVSAPVSAAPPEDIVLLKEIRDLLKK